MFARLPGCEDQCNSKSVAAFAILCIAIRNTQTPFSRYFLEHSLCGNVDNFQSCYTERQPTIEWADLDGRHGGGYGCSGLVGIIFV